MIRHAITANIWSFYSKEEWNQIFTSERLPWLKPQRSASL